MSFNPERHHRRTIRLRGYDYRSEGAYFVTICVKKRACVFGRINDGAVQHSEIGQIAYICWEAIPEHFPRVTLDEFIIMPNHMHGFVLIGPPQNRDGANPIDGGANPIDGGRDTIYRVPTGPEQFGRPASGSLSTIVRSYKAAVTRQCRQLGHNFTWQPRFYDHIIRNEQALKNIRRYIAHNPLHWKEDRFYGYD